jgi:hypothetical protein
MQATGGRVQSFGTLHTTATCLWWRRCWMRALASSTTLLDWLLSEATPPSSRCCSTAGLMCTSKTAMRYYVPHGTAILRLPPTLLLDRGANPNARHIGFGVALEEARDEGHHAMVALLLARGAIYR